MKQKGRTRDHSKIEINYGSNRLTTGRKMNALPPSCEIPNQWPVNSMSVAKGTSAAPRWNEYHLMTARGVVQRPKIHRESFTIKETAHNNTNIGRGETWVGRFFGRGPNFKLSEIIRGSFAVFDLRKGWWRSWRWNLSGPWEGVTSWSGIVFEMVRSEGWQKKINRKGKTRPIF